MLEGDVLAIDVPEIVKPLREGRHVAAWPDGDPGKSMPIRQTFARDCCARRHRPPSRCRTTNKTDKFTAPHARPRQGILLDQANTQ